MWACICIDEHTHIIKTAKLKVENSAQTSFMFSPVSFHAARPSLIFMFRAALLLRWGLEAFAYFTAASKNLPAINALAYFPAKQAKEKNSYKADTRLAVLRSFKSSCARLI